MSPTRATQPSPTQQRYPIRPIEEHEYPAWARAIANTYGRDLGDEELARERAVLQLSRTLGAFDDGRPVGGAAVHPKTMTVPGGRSAEVAGVTWVGVAPTHRRRGILTAMMRRQLAELYESRAEAVAALNAAEAGIYGRFGYGLASSIAQARGEKSAMAFRPGVDTGAGAWANTSAGTGGSAGTGSGAGTGTGASEVRLLARDEALALMKQVYERVWPRSVGWTRRPAAFWEYRLYDAGQGIAGATAPRFAVYGAGGAGSQDAPVQGAPQDAAEQNPPSWGVAPPGRSGQAAEGYVIYRLKPESSTEPGAVHVVELAAATRQAHAALWQFLIGIDLLAQVAADLALDDPLRHLLVDPRAVRLSVVDNLWVRLVDVGRALAGRGYARPVDLVLEVEDDFCPWNAGRYRLEADAAAEAEAETRIGPTGGASARKRERVRCERTHDPAHLRLSATELGAAYLGGTSLAALAAAGRVEELRPGALAEASAAFRGEREPFYPGGAAFPAY